MNEAAMNVTGLPRSDVPPELRDHPLIKNQIFFTLPSRLWEAILQEVEEGRFKPDLLAIERDLSHLNGDHTHRVGFWDGQPICHTLLHREPIRLSAQEAEFLGLV